MSKVKKNARLLSSYQDGLVLNTWLFKIDENTSHSSSIDRIEALSSSSSMKNLGAIRTKEQKHS